MDTGTWGRVLVNHAKELTLSQSCFTSASVKGLQVLNFEIHPSNRSKPFPAPDMMRRCEGCRGYPRFWPGADGPETNGVALVRYHICPSRMPFKVGSFNLIPSFGMMVIWCVETPSLLCTEAEMLPAPRSLPTLCSVCASPRAAILTPPSP